MEPVEKTINDNDLSGNGAVPPCHQQVRSLLPLIGHRLILGN